MSRPPDTEALLPRHAEDETLLAYLDGELDAAQDAATAGHLEQCWHCRSRVNALEASIHEFLAAREHLLPTDLPVGPTADASFRRRLAAHAEVASPRPALRALLEGWRWRLTLRGRRMVPSPGLRYALTSLAIVALVLVAVSTWWSVPVSAAHVLARAEVHELLDVRCSDYVVRSVVDVDRVDVETGASTRLGVVETHTDPASFAVRVNVRTGGGALDHAVLWGRDALGQRQPMAGAFPAQLARYFALHDWAPGVEVRGYLRLVADRGDPRVVAKRAGGLFEISHPFGSGHASGLSEARLYVDARTWFPVRVSLFGTAAEGRYELRFTRSVLEFLPRTTEFATLFASARPGLASHDERRGESEPARATASNGDIPRRPLPLAWNASPASDEEVAVAEALHETGADLGEEVNVFPMSDGSLLVQGLVDTESRRQEIEQALQQVPGELRIEIHLPAELRTGSELFAPPWRAIATVGVPERPPSAAPVVVADAAGRQMPVQQQLDEHFARVLKAGASDPDPSAVRQAAAAYASGIVSRSRQALFHAWALYRLEQQFGDGRGEGLSAPAIASVARIRRSHRDALSRLAYELAASVAPLTGSRSDAARVAAVGMGTPTLLQTVADADALVRELFTVSTARVEPGVSLGRLHSLLDQVAQERDPLS